MTTIDFRNLNDTVSLTVMTLMVMVLAAGPVNLVPDAAGSDDCKVRTSSVRHNRE